MSGFTCSLHAATQHTPAEIVDMLRTNLPFVTSVAEHPRPRFLLYTLHTLRDALQIHVRQAIAESIEERFGFRPTVTVSFELDKDLDEERHDVGQGNTMLSLDWIIAHVAGDMVYLINTDLPGLLRRGRQIWLDDRDTYWRPDDLAKLTFSYEWKKLE